jgi:hypothetical protein
MLSGLKFVAWHGGYHGPSSHAISLPPTRYFYQVKYARGYPFVPVKLAGRVHRGAAMIARNPKGCAVNPTSDGCYELDGA